MCCTYMDSIITSRSYARQLYPDRPLKAEPEISQWACSSPGAIDARLPCFSSSPETEAKTSRNTNLELCDTTYDLDSKKCQDPT